MTKHSVADKLVTMCDLLGITPDEALEALSGLTPAQRQSTASVPTIEEYLPTVEKATRPGARRTYSTYWKRLVSEFGDRRIDDVRQSELEALCNAMPDDTTTVRRSNWREGYQAQRSAIQAWRKFWSVAVGDRLVTANPAQGMTMNARKASARRGYTRDEVSQLYEVVATGGNDAELDCALFRLLVETAARRDGVLRLTVGSIDTTRQTVMLHEKGNQLRELPITRTLMEALLALARERGANLNDDASALLRYKSGAPLTRKRFETLFARIQRSAPFPDAKSASPHWCRHTCLTWLERVGGEAVAAAFAGHVPPRSRVTGLYTTAPTPEVVRAWCAVWNEPHPLALDRAAPAADTNERPPRMPTKQKATPGARRRR